MINVLFYSIFCFIGLFFGDYVFNGKRIVEAKAKGKPFLMFVYHGATQAIIQCWVYQIFGIWVEKSEFWFGILFIFTYTLITHTLTDYWKTKVTLNDQYNENGSFNKSRWWFIFGVDQLIHNISILIMIGITLWMNVFSR